MQDELNELFELLSLREPEEAEAQARSILTGLGFPPEQQDGPIGQLSGGWVGWLVGLGLLLLVVVGDCGGGWGGQSFCAAGKGSAMTAGSR